MQKNVQKKQMLNKKIIFLVLLSFLIQNVVHAGWFDKKIKVSKCYDYPHQSYKHKVEKLRSLQIQGRKVSLIWDWELNLKDKTAKRITSIDGVVDIEEFNLIVTDDYLLVKENSSIGNVTTLFDKNTEKVKTTLNGYTNVLNCNFD